MTEKTGLKGHAKAAPRRQKTEDQKASPRSAKIKRAPAQVPDEVSRLYPAPDDTRRSSVLVRDAGEPFWKRVPQLALTTITVLFWPIQAVRFVLDTMLSACLCAIFVGLGLWGTGVITNEQAEGFLANLGERGLELARSLGLPL